MNTPTMPPAKLAHILTHANTVPAAFLTNARNVAARLDQASEERTALDKAIALHAPRAKPKGDKAD